MCVHASTAAPTDPSHRDGKNVQIKKLRKKGAERENEREGEGEGERDQPRGISAAKQGSCF